MGDEHYFLNGKKVVKRQMLSKSSQQIINGVSVSLESSFGCLQAPIRRNAYFIQDDVMMFLCGKHIVLYDIIRRRQSYIMKPSEDEQVQAFNFCITASRMLLIAMALKSTSKILPTVKVYNRKKQQFYQLVHSHLLPNSTVFEVAFVGHGKNLITLTKSDDGYGATVFHIMKEIVVQYLPLKGVVSFIEGSFDSFAIGGPQYLTIYSFNIDTNLLDEVINLYELIVGLKQDEILLDCAALLDDSRVLITSHNRLVYFKGKQFMWIKDCYIEDPSTIKVILKDQPVKKVPKQLIKPKLSTITKTMKGFVIGMIGRPILQVFELYQDDAVFKGSYLIKDENIYGIHQVHLAADEMFAAITVVHYNKSAYQVANPECLETPSCENIIEKFQGKIELFTFNLAIVEALRTVQKDPFEALFEKGVHRGSILGLATNPMRAVIATVCEDRTCKFWDYANDFKELFSHQFHETPLCVALHPLSFMCAIGFKEGMRLYYVLDDDLKLLFTENMKNCNAVAFSEGGHILAASNATTVCLFHPLKFTLITSFPNHQSNLKELYFVEKDLFLVTICQLGILYVWNTQTNQRVVDHSFKQHKYNAVVYDSYYDLVVGACADYKIKVYKDQGKECALETDTSPTLFTCITISQRYGAIFFGTSQGSIRIYAYPFYNFNPKTMEYIEIPVHQAVVTQIKLSPCNSYLITASADGSIFFSKVKQYLDGKELSQLDLLTSGDLAGKFTNTFALNSLSLCSRLTQDQRKEIIKELDFRLQNFKSDIEDEKERLITTYNHQIKLLEESNQKQLTELRDSLSQTIQNSDQQTSVLKNQIEDFKKQHKETLKSQEEEQNSALMQFYDQRDALQALLNLILDKQRQQKEQGLSEYETTLAQVDEEYLKKYQELYQRFSEAMMNMKSDQKKFKEVLQQGEKEYETFYKESQQGLQNKLNKKNKKTEDLRSSISKFTKENERLQHRREFLRNLIKDTTNQIQSLEQELASYQEKHTNMMNQLEEKEDLINQREQQIKDFRMKNVHLQNFQKVYDYRVNTLKDEREPLMEHLKNMDKHVKNLYNELIEEAGLKQQYEQDKMDCEKSISELKIRLRDRFSQAATSKRKIEILNYDIKKLIAQSTEQWTSGLNKLLKHLQQENGKNLALSGSIFEETMRDMQKDPIQEQIDKITSQNIQKELSSQKGFLQKKLVNVQTSVKTSLEDRNQTYYSIQSTNTQLINECNRLRDTKQRLKEHIDKQTKAFREIRRELHSEGIEITDNPELITEHDSEDIPFEDLGDSQPRQQAYTSQKTPYAQYEEQRHALERKQMIERRQQPKLFNELYKEMQRNVSEENFVIKDRYKQKTNNYLKPSDSAIMLPTVISKASETRPTIQVHPDSRQQMQSAGQYTVTRGSKNTTNTNFFLQTHTTMFSHKPQRKR